MLDMAINLPEPNGGFEWVQAPAGSALVCRPLSSLASHIFTTRRWALGSRTERDAGPAWIQITEAMAMDEAALVRVRQVHGADAHVRHAGAAPLVASPQAAPDADIMVSNDPELLLAIQTADCVPLLMADARTGLAVAAHAGWRGIAARVAARAVAVAVAEFGSQPADLVAAIGPSIGACCYEVGEDVRTQFERAGFSEAELERWFLSTPHVSRNNPSMANLPRARRSGHWFFDMWTATADQLEHAGLAAGRVHCAELCTASHANLFASYRRDGVQAGRLAAAITSARHRPWPRWPDDRHRH